MRDRQPGQTASAAAAARAAHLVVDSEPYIFRDPLAMALLGDRAEEMIGYHRAHGDHIVLSGTRAQVTTRSRYTEQRLAEPTRRGLTQYVILGAGPDTFAYRSPLVGRLRVFEADHPATQRWKRSLLTAARIAPPDALTRVGVDLETASLVERLVAEGFDPSKPALVSCLGVSFYLTDEAVAATLTAIGGLAPGTELVVEYALPPRLRDATGRAYAEFALAVSEERGEPWLTFLSPEQMSALLQANGLEVIEHARQHDAIDTSLWRRSDALRPADLCRLARAAVPAALPLLAHDTGHQ